MISTEGQRGQRTHPGMGHQPLCFGALLHFLLDRLRQLSDRRGHRSSKLSRSRRRRLAHGANRNDSSCFRPASRHKRFLQRGPSLSATTCNWFMIRVRACTIRCPGATAVAADPDSPSSLPRSAESDLRATISESAEHPGDRSSACAPAGFDLGCVPDPQLKLQFRKQSFKPARMPACLHPTRTFIPWPRRSR